MKCQLHRNLNYRNLIPVSTNSYDLMTSCWDLDSRQRPKFENLQCDVSELLEAAAGYMELPLSLNWKKEEELEEGETAAEL